MDVKEGHFLTIFGQYILTPRIFELLGDNIRRNMREKGEFQLTSCMDRLRQEEGFRITSYNVCYTKLLRIYSGR